MKLKLLLAGLCLAIFALAGAARAQTQFGNGINFTNENQYISVTNFGNIIPGGEVTIEYWVNLASSSDPSGDPVVSLTPDQYPTNRFATFLNADALIYWEFGNVSTNGQIVTGIPPDLIRTWKHFAFVASQSGKFMTIYENGELLATQTNMAPFSPGSFELKIGRMTGQLNDFRIWNVARTQAQIQNSLGAPLVGNESGLILYFRLDNTSGAVATNSATATGAAYNGTLVNGPLWATGPYGETAYLSDMSGSSATITGRVFPVTTPTSYFFQYGTTTNYGNTTATGTIGVATNFYPAITVSSLITGLTPKTSYHYRLVVSNAAGTQTGADMAFVSGTGYWTPLSHTAPASIVQMFLLSDATVMAQFNSSSGSNWYKLTPDSLGHYIKGTWTNLPASTYVHYYGSTVVLTNGKVFVAGGEYGNGGSAVEIFNPVNNTWSTADNSTYFGSIADGNGVLLNNGQVLVEPQNASTNFPGQTFTFNPANNQFTQTAAPVRGIGEATWVKLPNDSILTVDSGGSYVGTTNAEVYVPSTGAWVDATSPSGVPLTWANFTGSISNVGNGFIRYIVSETGPAGLLPNGKAIFFGGNGNTAIYTPGTGTWSQGPSIPGGLVCADSPGAMMNNGNVLIQAGPVVTCTPLNPSWATSSSFYEFDYTANAGAGGYTQTTAPGGGFTNDDVTFIGRMVDLPDGSILWADQGSQLYVYTPASNPIVAGKPTIYSASQNGDGSLHLTGTLFNGISQGASYGDDAQMDSNFPLVRFTDAGGTVRYGRTYNWSSTSVMTGTAVLTTESTIPPGASLNDSIQVVANGNASDAVKLNYALNGITWVDFNYSGGGYNGSFATPYNTIATGVSGAASGGLLEIKASSSSETIQITKPMRIVSYGGTAHIGP